MKVAYYLSLKVSSDLKSNLNFLGLTCQKAQFILLFWLQIKAHMQSESEKAMAPHSSTLAWKIHGRGAW